MLLIVDCLIVDDDNNIMMKEVMIGVTLLLLFVQCTRSSSVLAPGEVSMGTTILALRFNEGIVVGADT